ncbi:MAG: clostripain-related cysteine peptidase [bacterium]
MLKRISIFLGVVILSGFIGIANLEAQDYGIDISTNQSGYTPGDTLIETAHLWNSTLEDKVVDIKNWVSCPSPMGLISIHNIPGFSLPAGFDFTGDVFSYVFAGSEPEGTYSLGARLIHSVTGDILSQDFVPVSFGPVAMKEWTYLVYIAADNNLEDAGIDDFLEMATVGSSDDVNIVVQFDRISGYDTSYEDWKTTKRFLITPGMTPTPANALMDIGEANMGDMQVLKDFVEWGITNYPANKYALVLWNHGSGILPKLGEQAVRGVCWDDTNGGYLTMDEVETALSGKMMNFLGYDACLMAMIEVAYEPKVSSEVMVGSEETEPWDGWPYDPILAQLTANPGMDAAMLGSITVREYINSYPADPYVTLSAVNTTAALDNLATAVSNLADAMVACGEWTNIKAARSAAEDFGTGVDLYDFAEEIYYQVTDPTVQSAAIAVGSAINNAVIAEAHHSGHPGAHGLVIYFPTSGPSASYLSTNFANNTTWDEFLAEYATH